MEKRLLALVALGVVGFQNVFLKIYGKRVKSLLTNCDIHH